MKKFKEQNFSKLIFIIFEVFSIISCIICMIFINVENKILITLLPFGFFLITLLFCKNYKIAKDNITFLIIETLYFIRLSLLPFLYAFNCNMQLFEGKINVEHFINKSCLLMLYEFCAIQIVIYWHIYLKSANKVKVMGLSFKENISKYFIIVITCFIIMVCIFMPRYATEFKTIFNLSDANFTITENDIMYQTGTVGRIVKTLFSMCFQIFRILLPAYIIRKLCEKKIKSKTIFLILIIICLMQFLFLTSTFAEAIIACLVIILYYIHLFPKEKKKMFTFAIICTIGIMILYFSVRYFVKIDTSLYSKSNGPISYMAQIISAYFTGVDNVAAMLGAIPFNSTLFGNRGNKLQYFYNSYNRAYGQIPPTIGTGYYYFGTLLAPIISMLFVKLSLIYYDKAQKIGKSIKYIAEIFCSIVFALGTVMYSPSITLAWFFGWGIPMLILTSFTGEK